MKYFAVYKCPLCGKLSRLSDSVEIPYEELPKILGKVVQNQLFAGNPYLHQAPMHVPCKCDNGDAGLAYFAGFVKDESINGSPDGATQLLNNIMLSLKRGKK